MTRFSLFFFIIFLPLQLLALDVQEIITKKGIKLWFVKDNTVPIISINFSFKGGTYFDLTGKEGTANLVASLLDEGVENITGFEFKEKMKSLGMKLSFSASKDEFSGVFQTIEENKEESFRLLQLAINKPTFSLEGIEKVKNQVRANIRIRNSDLQKLSSILFEKNFYKGHKFSRSDIGTLSSIEKINRNDLLNYINENFNKSNLVIGVAGNIEEKDLLELIDSLFGNLQEGTESFREIPRFLEFSKGISITKKETPQTSVIFGHKGIMRNDKDFFAARVANYILGGGGFQSKLYKKIREEKGLVYSIYSYLVPYLNDGVILGGFQTKNESVNKTIELLKKEWSKIQTHGVTKKELEDAKSYFLGSFSRNFTNTRSIAGLLNTIQFYELGYDYFIKRKEIIKNLNIKNVNEICKKLFNPDQLFFKIVGNPQ